MMHEDEGGNEQEKHNSGQKMHLEIDRETKYMQKGAENQEEPKLESSYSHLQFKTLSDMKSSFMAVTISSSLFQLSYTFTVDIHSLKA